jgi:hypothetical protein
MYAILRQYTYDIAKIAHAEEALTVAQGLHAAQPSYAGSIVAADGQPSSPSTSGGRRTTRRQTRDDRRASAAAPQAADDSSFPAAYRRRSGSKRSWKPVHHPGHYHVR